MAAIAGVRGRSTTATSAAVGWRSASIPLLVAALALAAVAQGAHYRDAQLGTGALIAAAVITAGPRCVWESITGHLRGIASAIGALAIWTVVSAGASGHLSAAVPVVALLVGLVAVMAIAVSAGEQDRRALLSALLAVGMAVAAGGWVGVTWRISPWAHVDQGLWRAASTLTYANAAAALLAPLALLAAARLVDRDALPARATSFVLFVGIGATMSRAGLLAASAGLVVLAIVLGPRKTIAALAPVLVGAVIAIAALVPSMTAASAAHPAVAVAGLLAGAVVVVWLGATRSPKVLVGLALMALVLLVPVARSGMATRAMSALTSGRVTVDSPDRVHEAGAALRLAATRPVTGVGPGQAHLTWTEPGKRLFDSYAHDEYLQVLVDLGAPGVVLLGWVLAAVVAVLHRSRRRTPVTLWAGVIAGLTALAIHSAFDFLWHIPVIPLMAAVLVGVIANAVDRQEQLAPIGNNQQGGPTQ
ncbi:MAG: O-antigen ligase family protein [Acidimicrobiia bacterium]|nr:O-antigen ligase family protein [Acidimicrobiia bacterium]